MADLAGLQNSGLTQRQSEWSHSALVALEVLLIIELMLLCVVLTVGNKGKLLLWLCFLFRKIPF